VDGIDAPVMSQFGQASLGSGDIVGRAWSAAPRIDDPRVSEAHARG